jgi:predicted dehydrogenase
MATRLKAGILGTGHAHATGKLRVLQQSADWELVGVCEPDPEWRARAERDKAWAGVKWLGEEQLLADPSVRVIAVESEVRQLLALGQKAIDAGKHIHLDKPAGADQQAFHKLLMDAKRRRLIVQMGYMFRYNPGFGLIRQAVKEGWLGRVHYLHGSMNSNLPAEKRKALAFHPGGMMFELGCHLMDMLVLLMGRPQKVTPTLRHDAAFDDTLADNTVAVFEFDRAVAVVESAAMEAHPSQRRHFEVCGDGGSIVLQPLEPPAVRLCLSKPQGRYAAGWQNVELKDVPRYVGDMEELARCIRGEAHFPYSYAHDEIVQETVLRASGVLR